jgi:glucose/arabinose dehydrogenase
VSKLWIVSVLMLGAAGLWAADARGTDYRLVTVAEGLDFPWCVAFLPDGNLLVTERSGQLRRVQMGPAGHPSAASLGDPIVGVPPVYVRGQGGLFDVLLDPDFAANQTIYLTYAHGDASANATRVARARLQDTALTDLEVIFTVTPAKATPQHYGGRIDFLPDGTLLLATGEGWDYREQAQNLGGLLGKTVRINTDGSIPADNPFVDVAAADPAIWSYGHRNPQGLAVDRNSGTVWLHEHGPLGGDELNALERGLNYGWPVITHGLDYNGAYVTPFTERAGMEQPVLHWTPSIGPSGLAIYRGEHFPQWQGDLFVGALIDAEVRRIRIDAAGAAVEQHAMFSEIGTRIRDVRVSPDGYIYILTDSANGKLIRVEPLLDG